VRIPTPVRPAVLWLIACFLAWVFFRQGLAKFSSTSGWATAFRVWHYPDWFRIAVGVAEVAAAGLVLIPRTAFAGGLLIVGVMLGAMGTHVYWGNPGQVTSEVLPLLLGTLLALGRRKEFFAFRALRVLRAHEDRA
jgi:uncharacterized membrane protein YphA (DoxX/SURF4 family)